jgi:P27 family predicted phage terminase small subunit
MGALRHDVKKSIAASPVGLLNEVPEPPDYVDDPIAVATWRQAARFLVLRKVLTSADLPTLATYCNVVSNVRYLQEGIRETGVVLDGGKPSPLLSPLNTATKSMKELALVLGLVPFARQSLGKDARDAIDDDTTQEASPLAGILKNRTKRNGEARAQE